MNVSIFPTYNFLQAFPAGFMPLRRSVCFGYPRGSITRSSRLRGSWSALLHFSTSNAPSQQVPRPRSAAASVIWSTLWQYPHLHNLFRLPASRTGTIDAYYRTTGTSANQSLIDSYNCCLTLGFLATIICQGCRLQAEGNPGCFQYLHQLSSSTSFEESDTPNISFANSKSSQNSSFDLYYHRRNSTGFYYILSAGPAILYYNNHMTDCPTNLSQYSTFFTFKTAALSIATVGIVPALFCAKLNCKIKGQFYIETEDLYEPLWLPYLY